jgi:hypothetical protein
MAAQNDLKRRKCSGVRIGMLVGAGGALLWIASIMNSAADPTVTEHKAIYPFAVLLVCVFCVFLLIASVACGAVVGVAVEKLCARHKGETETRNGDLCSSQGIGVLSQLPDDLSYLIAPALKYGRFHPDVQMIQFLGRATSDELEELAMIADRVLANNHYPAVICFLDQYPIDVYQEAANLYFLFGVLDYADLHFDHSGIAEQP